MAFTFLLGNQEDGFSEALLRGLRSSFLTDLDYTNLKEGGQRGGGGGGAGAGAASSSSGGGAGAGAASSSSSSGAAEPSGAAREDFEDLRLTLQETDYGNFLQAEPALDPKIIATRATQKWVAEIKYVRAGATGRLARFLDFVSFEYMIDNILDLVKAATSSASVDMQAVVDNCHPLGMLEPAVMKSILAYEDLGEDFHALYRTILVDTPVGRYFTMFLQEAVDEKAATDPDSVRATFAEIPMTLIENSVKKFYLEDFHRFCLEEVGGETAEIMGALLSARADMLTINITYNSLSTDFSRGGRGSRAALFPAFGHLYPGGSELLATVEDEDALRRVLAKSYPDYAALWDHAPVDARGVRDVSDAFFRHAVHMLELAFEGQFHYAPFYAYVKLKEQEAKNIAWLATCLEHGVYGEMERIIPVFSRNAQKQGGVKR